MQTRYQFSAKEIIEAPAWLQLIPWTGGRSGGGYKKFCLFASETFGFDCHLILYTRGDSAKRHKDPAPAWAEHHRVNVTLVRPTRGGIFKVRDKGPNGVIWSENPRVVIMFRPDIYEHWVTPVAEGYRLVLSFGWLRRKKTNVPA